MSVRFRIGRIFEEGDKWRWCEMEMEMGRGWDDGKGKSLFGLGSLLGWAAGESRYISSMNHGECGAL